MARVLVTRPEPGAGQTAAALEALGHTAVVRPLMTTEPLAWTIPDEAFDAVMLTSAAAPRHAGPEAKRFKALPALCVGEACAWTARAAGFGAAEAAGADVSAVLDHATRAGMRRLLHLAGEDRTAVVVPAGLTVIVRVVYKAVLQALADPGPVDAVMLYSVRSARHFASQWGERSRNLVVVAISTAVGTAAGEGWRRVIVADTSDEASMLAALAGARL